LIFRCAKKSGICGAAGQDVNVPPGQSEAKDFAEAIPTVPEEFDRVPRERNGMSQTGPRAR
jgi:hypothetical protein